MTALSLERYTLEEYLKLDENSDERLEFWDGRVVSLGGASDQHDQIEGNLRFRLRLRLNERDCRIFSSRMRIAVPSAPPYRYSDLSALCGKPKFEKLDGVDVLTNPSLIIEVLSHSTEAYDRGDKFSRYKSIPTLTENLLVAQHRPHVSQFLKQPDGSWNNLEFNDLGETLKVVMLDCDLALAEIYEDVNFGPPKLALR